MYQALYRKWRPRTFDDVVGQSHITQTLKRQVETGRLSHAYLFTGTRGTGKTTCAKLLARAVNCERPVNGNPCNQCPACLGIENGSILDVLELDAASNNKVDDIRAILDEAVYTPASVKKRVYIVDEVHMLSPQAFNALLQILEEPPAHLMFILATTEVHKVPATIKSRCQQFSFKRIHTDDIAARLDYVARQEGVELTAEGAALIARLADGGMRDALSLLDQCVGDGGAVDEARVYDTLGLAGNLETAALLERVAGGDTQGALERLDRLYAGGKEMAALVGELSALVRDLLVRRTAPEAGAALMTGGYDAATMRRLGERMDTPRLVQMLNTLQRTGMDLNRSSNRRTDVELCLLTLCDPTLDGSAAGLAARVARLEQAAQAGELTAPRPAPAAEPAPAPAPEPTPRDESPAPRPPKQEARREDTPPREEPAPAQPVPRQCAGERSWPGWSAIREALKDALPASDYGFVSNSAMVEGCWDGKALTVWTVNDFVQGQLEAPAVLGPIAQVAGRLMGGPVHAVVRVGRAPAQLVEPEPAPAQPEGEQAQPDALEAFLSGGQDNVTVE